MKKSQLDFLARWEIDEFKASGRSIYTTPKFISLYIVIAIILIFLGSSPWLYTFTLDRKLAVLDDRVNELSSVHQKVAQLDDLKTQVIEANQVIDIYNQSKLDPNEVFSKIMPLLPSGTTVSSLTIQEDRSFQITVNMPTPVDVVRLWVSIGDSGLFQSIDINTVSLQDKPQALSLTLRFTEADELMVIKN